jgi:hypothetical protein
VRSAALATLAGAGLAVSRALRFVRHSLEPLQIRIILICNEKLLSDGNRVAGRTLKRRG